MKKIILSVITIILLVSLAGCGKISSKEAKNNFIDKITELKQYYMEGKLSIQNNDDVYNYDVKVAYKQDDNYKVTMINSANNYEQTILKNSDAVYVTTPSLNKSYKFQSTWPNNYSQSYLLHSIMNDLKNDNDSTFEEKDNLYTFTTNVNYPNNPNLVKQTITVDKDFNLKEVAVKNSDDISIITFKVTSLDTSANFNDQYFEIDESKLNITENENSNEEEKVEEQKTPSTDETPETKQTPKPEAGSEESSTPTDNIECTGANCETEKTEETKASIDDNIFPMYIPTNTSLTNKEVINKDDGQRVIMTFSGSKPFILVQETATKSDNFTIIPTYGEPYMLIDTVGALTDVSYTWISGGIEYYIVSDVMNQTELLEVAKSINVIATSNEK